MHLGGSVASLASEEWVELFCVEKMNSFSNGVAKKLLPLLFLIMIKLSLRITLKLYGHWKLVLICAVPCHPPPPPCYIYYHIRIRTIIIINSSSRSRHVCEWGCWLARLRLPPMSPMLRTKCVLCYLLKRADREQEWVRNSSVLHLIRNSKLAVVVAYLCVSRWVFGWVVEVFGFRCLF